MAEISNFVPDADKKKWVKKTAIGAGLFLFTVLFVLAGAAVYRDAYAQEVLPGVYLGQYHLGGLNQDQVEKVINNFNDRIAKESLRFNFDHNSQVQNFELSPVSTEDTNNEMAKVNSEATAAKLLAVGKSGHFWQDLWQPLHIRFFANQHLTAEVAVEDKFITKVENYLAPFADPAQNATVKITSLTPLAYSIEKERTGYVFDLAEVKNNINSQLSQLSLAPITVVKRQFQPDVFVPDVESITAKLPQLFQSGNLALTYTDPQTGIKRDWSIAPALYSQWLEVSREDGELVFALDKDKVKNYLETLRPLVDTAARDAKFVMEGEKVKEFQANQSGLSLNEDKTYADLDAAFQERNVNPSVPPKTVSVSVDTVEPAVTIGSLNNLGIMEVVGVGVSTFKDSHTNRIKNIANAVKRLNGTLIKPGEEFSANKYAGPYTLASGFLPEQVIKGNEIKPEVGGGMCQIGTTLFRMAMNTGLPITQRRNHSLVVSYYADPINGNPGTDATLYEPSLDLKFINETGNYLLLQTSIDYKKQQLVFTLWGKKDGRSGSYTHPIVSKWIPAGKPQEIVNTSLKPGERKCQGAFRGAEASFVYTRVTPSGEKIERVFDSYYRPLPQICMVGPTAAASSTPGADGPLDVSDSV